MKPRGTIKLSDAVIHAITDVRLSYAKEKTLKMFCYAEERGRPEDPKETRKQVETLWLAKTQPFSLATKQPNFKS